MSFSTKTKSGVKSSYTNDMANEFLLPLLSEAKLYQRVSGYFSTAGMDLYADALEKIAMNDGRIQFIVSKDISKADYEKIRSGYDLLRRLRPLRVAQRNAELTEETQMRLGNLAFLIAQGKAQVKVAFTEEGIFHDKFGLISSENDYVYFTGSMNETRSGLKTNYESISVDVSWDAASDVVQSRIQANKERFNRLWNNEEPNVQVIEASDLAFEEIAKYQPLATIPSVKSAMDKSTSDVKEGTIGFRLIDNRVVEKDLSEHHITITDRKLRPSSDIGHFFMDNHETVIDGATYRDIKTIIKVTTTRAKRHNVVVDVSDAVKDFLTRNMYSIEEYKILGEVYKGSLEEFPISKKESFERFSRIVQSEVSRPLRPLHLRAAYYEYEMERVANFSVPGAGKTAMVLGVFAYLNRNDSPKNEKINRLLVVCPINAFQSWKREFHAVFGDKKNIRVVDTQSSKDFDSVLATDWGVCNMVLVNYEALPSHRKQLRRFIDESTMLVFDEVHRIKNPVGIRAEAALSISTLPKFRYVLTGTPIPNSYVDIYNFLHLLYGAEYNAFFGWDPKDLKNPTVRRIDEINTSIHPFFWRTSKSDLNVPPADKDELLVESPSKEQRNLAEAIYFNEKSSLAILIRLIQASTNPALLNEKIDYDEVMGYSDENIDDRNDLNISKKDFMELLGHQNKPMRLAENDLFDLNNMISPKFNKGISLVVDLVNHGKKVIVWGVFVDTLKKIVSALEANGIAVSLVYGGTDKSNRVGIIDEFRDGPVQVLVSNPQTLGESISLHQTVHDAVYFEYNFNLTSMLQSRDRIHRLGLKANQHTHYYYLQTRDEGLDSNRPGFIDQKIYNKLKSKEKIMYSAIDDDTLSIQYTDNEILEAIHIVDMERKRILGDSEE